MKRTLLLVLVISLPVLLYLWSEKTSNEVNLIMAIANGSPAEVELRLQKITDFNYVSLKGDTPLNAAAMHGRLELVKYLVENGARIDLVDHYGNTAIMSALKNGHAEIAEYLKAVSG